MKKAYVKPGLFMESFEMAEHIAKCALNNKGFTDEFGSEGKTNFYANACNFIYNGFSFFSGTIENCQANWNENEDEFGICYQGVQFSSDNTIFGS